MLNDNHSPLNNIYFWLYKIYKSLPIKVQQPVRKWLIKIKPFLIYRIDKKVIEFINHLAMQFSDRKLVLYIQPTFLNFLGTDMYSGGAERYALDLGKIFQDQQFNFLVIQCSDKEPWIRHYQHITIIGIPHFVNQYAFTKYVQILSQHAVLTIQSPFTLCTAPLKAQKNMGISHGIYWDTPFFDANDEIKKIKKSIKNLDALISVDTATINFIRGIDIAAVKKLSYIPNYVESDYFNHDEIKKSNNEIVILYPRRLYGPRGFWLVHNLVPLILERFKNVKFIFCGKGDEKATAAAFELTQKYPSQVTFIHKLPGEMKAVYDLADIVLIPTVNSEGTSLSCIEAMARKKAIIASSVGGLTDLISDHFTGLLIPPDDEAALKDAIIELCENTQLRNTLAHNAYQKALSFDIKIWRKKWIRIIQSLLGEGSDLTTSKTNTNLPLLHLCTTGISFDSMGHAQQQLFTALAKGEQKCLFIDDNLHSIPLLPNKNLAIIGKQAKVDVSGYCVYTYDANHYAYLQLNPPALLVYDVLENADLSHSHEYSALHQKMLSTANIIITHTNILYEEYKKNYGSHKLIFNVPSAVNEAGNTWDASAKIITDAINEATHY